MQNFLIYKNGEESDPANYRPITILNSDYKILTSAIAKVMTEKLPEWMIPKPQLARNGVWGTVYGLLWDKSCAQAAKL